MSEDDYYSMAEEIVALKAERDELNSYNSHLIADREMLFAENTKLRAALEEIANRHKVWIHSYDEAEYARRELERNK